MSSKGRQSCPNSPRGEIDTSSPFNSVKHAVSLFVEFALSEDKTPKRKARAQSVETAFVKEMQLHLAEKELNKLKNHIKNAETTKAKALRKLDKAKTKIEHLTLKLKLVSEAKESAAKATESAINKLKHLDEGNDTNPLDADRDLERKAAQDQYNVAITELNGTKQELAKIRQDFDAVLEAKFAAFKHAEEAERAAKANVDKARALSKEISDMKELIGIVKAASSQSRQEKAKIIAEKEVQKQSYTKKLNDLKNEYDPEDTQKLEAQLSETKNEIESLRKQIENVKASDQESLKVVASALDGAEKSLQKVSEEESSLRSLVDVLKAELEIVKKERTQFMTSDPEMTKSEVARGEYNDMVSSLRQLSLETENAQKESEFMLLEAEEMKKEAENARNVLEEYETKLRVALEEAEEAKTEQTNAIDHVKALSDETSANSCATITICREEYESLSRKAEESDKQAEIKVAAAMVQSEAVKASEHEAIKKLEAYLKEMEEMKATTESALMKAEMADRARMAVERELQRWRERQKKECDWEENGEPKLEKARTSTMSRTSFRRSFSGMFHKKRTLSDGGSPSYSLDNGLQPLTYLPEHPTL